MVSERLASQLEKNNQQVKRVCELFNEMSNENDIMETDEEESIANEIWKYRDIQCVIYRHEKPDGYSMVGYARFGDKWVECIDTANLDLEQTIERVEKDVDRRLRRAIEDPSRVNPGIGGGGITDGNDNTGNGTDPLHPQIQRKWDDDGECDACRRLRLGTTWVGEPPKCFRHRTFEFGKLYWTDSATDPLDSPVWSVVQ